MKKLLLASTALVATAGVASAAEITLSGMAEMGIYDNGNDTAQFFTDVDVTFTMSGEADNGLTFGASVDLDESDGSNSTTTCSFTDTDVDTSGDGAGLGANPLVPTGLAAPLGTQLCTITSMGASNAFAPGVQGGESIFVSFGGATLTMGDTDGALDARVPEMGLAGGSLADDETTHLGFFTADGADGIYDGQVARFDYAYGPVIMSISAEQDLNGADSDHVFGIGFSYAANVSNVDLNVGIGYQGVEDLGYWTSVAATAGFANGLSAGVTYASYDDESVVDVDIEHVGVGVGYSMNALSVGLNWGQYEFDNGDETSGYGLAATYDLGGGMELRAGYGYSDFDIGGVSDDFDTFSMGARMNF
ncbi:porin [Roseivivax sp. CAU 1753]